MKEDAVEAEFRRFLARGKFRKTPERFTILRRVLTMDSHFDVESLHHALEGDGFHVSRATVYNTVELLEKAAILRKNEFGQPAAVYELTTDRHIHLVCRNCGSIQEIPAPPDLTGQVMALEMPGFKAESCSITVTGLCEKCSGSKSGS